MKRPTELIEKAKGFKSTDPIRVLAEYAVSLESPRKTVSDAVDCYNGIWPDDTLGVICFDDEYGWRCWNADWIECQKFYQVCTREEFEAEVERRKGEEWTHIDLEGDRCKVIHMHDDYVWVQYDSGKHSVYKSKFISKRKPSINKAEADAVKAFYDWAEKRPCAVLRVEDYLEQFEVK